MHSQALRRRMPRFTPAVLLLVPVLALSACGDSVPDDSVAKVDDTKITKKTFDHWMQIAAISAQGPAQGGAKPAVQIPQPPEFTDCVANKKKTQPKAPKGQPQL